jgi:hypothetical protein
MALTTGSGGTAAVVLLTTWKLPMVLILPAASLVLLVIGFALALAFWHRPSSSHQLSYRDVAAFLVFFGFAAGLLSDHSALGPLLDVTTR